MVDETWPEGHVIITFFIFLGGFGRNSLWKKNEIHAVKGPCLYFVRSVIPLPSTHVPLSTQTQGVFMENNLPLQVCNMVLSVIQTQL